MSTQRTPWSLWNGYGPLPDGNYAVARIGPIVGGLTGSEGHDIIGTKKTLEYVVQAINNHEALLEAAKKMADFLDTWEDTLAGVQMSQDVFDTDSGLSEALAAIAAAEGRTNVV